MSDERAAPFPTGAGRAEPPAVEPTGVNTLAIVGLVAALLGVGVAAVVCGHVALVQVRRSGERGRGLAIAALVLGYLGILALAALAAAYVSTVSALVSDGFLAG